MQLTLKLTFILFMAKRTRTMAETLKVAKKILNKNKKPRTSTIDATIASASAGFKAKKKPTKTRTMAETLQAASAGAPKTKKVAKAAAKKQGKKASKAQKTKKGKGKKGK